MDYLFNQLCTKISCFDCPLGEKEGCHMLFIEKLSHEEQIEVLKGMIDKLPKEDK